MHDLDPGEAEAIALAVEIGADRILMDEKEAGRLHSIIRSSRLGVLGVLLRAKPENLILRKVGLTKI